MEDEETLSLPLLAQDFPFHANAVVEIDAEAAIHTAFKTLVEYEILSLPVYNVQTKQYVGWFDVGCMISLFLTADSRLQNMPIEKLTQQHILNLIHEEILVFNNFSLGSHSSLLTLFKTSLCPIFPWLPVSEVVSMKQVIFQLRNQTKRVPVFDKSNRVKKIISQNAIIQFMQEILMDKENNNEEISELFDLTVADCHFIKPVESVTERDNLRSVLEKMQDKKHTAIAITDMSGKLFSCITSKDLLNFESLENFALDRMKYELEYRNYVANKGQNSLIRKPAFKPFLETNVIDFISAIRQKKVTKKARPSVITVTEELTLRRVIGKLAKCKIHRVFVVNDQGEPIGVASVKDVISALFPQ